MNKLSYLTLVLLTITLGFRNNPNSDLQSNYGHVIPVSKPEKVGLSSDRLNRIKPFMQRYIDENKIPGMITLVARHGKIVHFEKYGMMDTDKPMQFNTIFAIKSMTKPVVSVAAMMLYEEGCFQLDDPVAKYIPEFKDLKVFSYKDKDGIHLEDQKNPMTIHDLLTHTSGLSYGWYGNTVDSIYRAANIFEGTVKDMIQKLSKIPLLFQPGTKFNYSVSTDVLGYLVEIISGKSLDIFLQERIFTPLKMTDTGFYVPKEKIDRFAALYSVTDNGFKVIDKPESSKMTKPPTRLSGGGGLVSTASDYLIFAQMLSNKGEFNSTRLLGTKTVELMTQNHLSEELIPIGIERFGKFNGYGFGLGFAIMVNNINSHISGSDGEYGWFGINNTYFWIDPTEELIWIQLGQYQPAGYYPINKEFKVLVYQSIID
ncbi:MAG: serine hydrolase domain-containing protein [Bacteroidota bacterium]